jgi:hypothetical protein
VHYVIASPGAGKTFLAKIIGWRACQAKRRVLFTTAMDVPQQNRLSGSRPSSPCGYRRGRSNPTPKLAIFTDYERAPTSQNKSELVVDFWRANLLCNTGGCGSSTDGRR